mgnify:CR=1 FL=1
MGLPRSPISRSTRFESRNSGRGHGWFIGIWSLSHGQKATVRAVSTKAREEPFGRFIPIAGSLWALAVGSLAYIFALLCLGLLISTVAQNHMQALQISMAFMLPTIFFSGFIFPRETLPWIFYAISTVLPATYYIELVRGVVLRGALFSEYVNALVALVLIGLTLFAVCTMRFRRTIG